MTIFNLVIGLILAYIVLALLGFFAVPALLFVGSRLWFVLIILLIIAFFSKG